MANLISRKFRFVSPGVFLNEIDNSHLPSVADELAVGPVVIGNTVRGPALRPVKVNSFSEFIDVFGNPHPGGESNDVYREGNKAAPTYAAYAAQAWLKNNAPLTVIRLAGVAHSKATTAGVAGWKLSNTPTNTEASNGGAYSLFLAQSGTLSAHGTGSLAATWYLDSGYMLMSGTLYNGGDEVSTNASGAAIPFLSTSGVTTVGGEHTALIYDSSHGLVKRAAFNFDKNSDKYIRKVFNTNPQLTNSRIVSSNSTQVNYWLGESYDRTIKSHSGLASTSTAIGILLPLAGTGVDGGNLEMSVKVAKTGWIFSQDLTTDATNFEPSAMQKLFRFITHNEGGEWEQNNLKISIKDVKYSKNHDVNPYGSFTVLLRKVNDTDNAPKIIEQYTNCNLDPTSLNYVARKIGDRYVSWDDTERRYREYGQYGNQSKYIRVEMNEEVDYGATDAEYLPFGFHGIPVFDSFALLSGSATVGAAPPSIVGGALSPVHAGPFIKGIKDGIYVGNAEADPYTGHVIYIPGTDGDGDGFYAQYDFPSIKDFFRSNSAENALANHRDAYFGINPNTGSAAFDASYRDYVRAKPNGVSSWDSGNSDPITITDSFFTLDDIKVDGGVATYVTGSRTQAAAADKSLTALSGTYKGILDAGFDKFTMPLFGGFNGVDITEMDPFNQDETENLSNTTQETSYVFNSIKRAIDSVADPEAVEMNLLVAPGVTNESLTSHMINVCENRADAMAIIDPKGGLSPRAEKTGVHSSRTGNVSTVVSNLEARRLDSSYAAAYYPWVQIRDAINGAVLWAPPSLVALGTYASNDRNAAPWFAPAGFTRGGLSEGAAGIPVVGIDGKLNSRERDKLYEVNINPIASFPAEGLVVFGQKTLQASRSALDRVNVRRLLIYVKKEISRISARMLFKNNVSATWNLFRGKVEPFLRSVKIGGGLVDFRVVLDETTTTPDMIDRNIMYAKIFLKPARAIEFIAIDFVVTDSGASFED